MGKVSHKKNVAELRQDPRIHIKQKIHCRDGQQFRLLYMTNLSKGGMFIKTTCPPPLGTMMRLGLHLPGMMREIEFTAKVVQSQPFGVGVQFLDVRESDMRQMEEFVAKQTAEQSHGVVLEGKLCHAFADRNFFMASQADLSQTSLPILLRYLQQQSWSGTLRLSKEQEFSHLTIRLGQLVDISTSHFNENFCLGRLLKRAGHLSKEAMLASLVEMQRTGKKQGTILLENGHLKWEEIQKGLEWQLIIKLDTLLRWEGGSYRFVQEAIPEGENWVEPELDLQFALYKSLYRQAHRQSDRILPLLCNFEDSEILPCEIKRLGRSYRPLFTSNREISTWHHIVHRNGTLRQLVVRDDNHENEVRAFVAGLLGAGLIHFDRDEKINNLVTSDNMFQRLNIPWTIADRQEVTAAHQRMIQLMPPGSGPEVKANLDEAREKLANDFQRRDYRKEVVAKQDLQQMADRLYKLGKLNLGRGNFGEALPLLKAACDLNPSTPEYNLWLERAKRGSR